MSMTCFSGCQLCNIDSNQWSRVVHLVFDSFHFPSSPAPLHCVPSQCTVKTETYLMLLWRIFFALSSSHSSFGPRTMRRRKQFLLARFRTLSTVSIATFMLCSLIVIFRNREGPEITKAFCPRYSLGALTVNEVHNSRNMQVIIFTPNRRIHNMSR